MLLFNSFACLVHFLCLDKYEDARSDLTRAVDNWSEFECTVNELSSVQQKKKTNFDDFIVGDDENVQGKDANDSENDRSVAVPYILDETTDIPPKVPDFGDSIVTVQLTSNDVQSNNINIR